MTTKTYPVRFDQIEPRALIPREPDPDCADWRLPRCSADECSIETPADRDRRQVMIRALGRAMVGTALRSDSLRGGLAMICGALPLLTYGDQ